MPDASGVTDLAGSSWILAEIGARLPPAGVEITLEFTATDVSGFSGCNRFAGAFHPDAATGSVSFGPLRSTRMACLDPAIGEVETAFLAALEGVREVRIGPAGRLNISGPTGERLVFVSRRDAESAPSTAGPSTLRTLALGLLTLVALAGHAFAGFWTLVLIVLTPDPGEETMLAALKILGVVGWVFFLGLIVLAVKWRSWLVISVPWVSFAFIWKLAEIAPGTLGLGY